MIELKNIYKSFGKNDVLKNISFQVNDGEIIAIIGKMGRENMSKSS